jgi:hypothetical protein
LLIDANGAPLSHDSFVDANVRFWGSPDMADYPPRPVHDANDPLRSYDEPKFRSANHDLTLAKLVCCHGVHG